METTVTMSLDRFKELEAAEKALEIIKSENPNGRFLYFKSSYGEIIVERSNTENYRLVQIVQQAVEARDQMIKDRK